MNQTPDPTDIPLSDDDLRRMKRTPQALSALGSVPFNPFLIANQQRSREVHLAGYPPTSLGGMLNVGDDASSDGTPYTSANRLPWALHFLDVFAYPMEKQLITTCYLNFASWAASGGAEYADWYIDPAARTPGCLY